MIDNARSTSLIKTVGIGLLVFGIGSLAYSYGPLIQAEGHYRAKQLTQSKQTTEDQQFNLAPTPTPIVPADTDFGIVIPKIEANAPIVADVDPYDSAAYQKALTKGVAQARGTGLPGSGQTMFLFAHASGDLLMARRYNSIFYLLNKLEPTDNFTIYFRGAPYTYQVAEIKTVVPSEVDYLTNDSDTDVILMTCTPPGTTWKRLLVLAKRVNN